MPPNCYGIQSGSIPDAVPHQNQINVKQFLIFLGIVTLSMYAIVSFISFTPNPSDWGNGGRGAFTFFDLLLSFVTYISFEECKPNKK